MPKIADTMVMSHLLNENLPENGLKYLTKLYLRKGVVEYKDAVEYGTHSKEFYNYAMDDAVNTYELYKLFIPQIEKEGLSDLFWKVEMPFQKALMWLAINGIKADVTAAKQMTYEVQHLYYEVENKLLEFFGGQYNVYIMLKARRLICEPSINFNSSDQVVPLIENLGFKIYEKSKKAKKKAWNKHTKKRLEGKHPIIDLLIKLGKVEKLLNTFLIPFEGFVNVDGRIRPSFHNTVCVTGRLSCSSPNIEQLPKNNDIANIRNLFVAERSEDASEPNNVLIVADYSGQEVRIMAEESGDKSFKSALINGLDLHQAVADELKISRDAAKTVVFGIAYGKTAYGLSKDFNCSTEKAQEFIDRFLNRYPGLKQAIENTKRQVYKHGFVRTMSSRKRRFPDFHKLNKWGKERCYRQAFNFKIQGYGADVMKVAAANVVLNPNLKLVNLVHDELAIECKKDYVEEGIKYIKDCMVKSLPISTPWKVDLAYAERYGSCK